MAVVWWHLSEHTHIHPSIQGSQALRWEETLSTCHLCHKPTFLWLEPSSQPPKKNTFMVPIYHTRVYALGAWSLVWWPALGISFQYQQRDQSMGHWNHSIFPGKAKVLPEVLLSCYTADSSAPADQTTPILYTNGPRDSLFPSETSQGRPPTVLLRLFFKAPREYSLHWALNSVVFLAQSLKVLHSPPQTMLKSVPAILC